MNPFAARDEKVRQTERRITVALICAACIVGFAWAAYLILDYTPAADRQTVELFAGELLLVAFAVLAVIAAFRKRR